MKGRQSADFFSRILLLLIVNFLPDTLFYVNGAHSLSFRKSDSNHTISISNGSHEFDDSQLGYIKLGLSAAFFFSVLIACGLPVILINYLQGNDKLQTPLLVNERKHSKDNEPESECTVLKHSPVEVRNFDLCLHDDNGEEGEDRNVINVNMASSWRQHRTNLRHQTSVDSEPLSTPGQSPNPAVLCIDHPENTNLLTGKLISNSERNWSNPMRSHALSSLNDPDNNKIIRQRRSQKRSLLYLNCTQTSRKKILQIWFSRCNCFAAGVFLSSGFMELYPDVEEAILEAKTQLNITSEFPFAPFLSLIGFFLVLTIEQTVWIIKTKQCKLSSLFCSCCCYHHRQTDSSVLPQLSSSLSSSSSYLNTNDGMRNYITNQTKPIVNNLTSKNYHLSTDPSYFIQSPPSSPSQRTKPPQLSPLLLSSSSSSSQSQQLINDVSQSSNQIENETNKNMTSNLFISAHSNHNYFVNTQTIQSQQHHQSIEQSVQENEQNFIKKQTIPRQTNDDHNHAHNHNFNFNETQTFGSMLRIILLLCAMSVHSLFEGLAVGLQPTTQRTIALFSAILLHKIIIASGIGVNMATNLNPSNQVTNKTTTPTTITNNNSHTERITYQSSSQPQTRLKCNQVFIYQFLGTIILASTSPLGLLIGWVMIREQEHSTSLILATAILQGLACGTFFYVVFCELLPMEFKEGVPDRIGKLIFLISGFLLVTLYSFLMPD